MSEPVIEEANDAETAVADSIVDGAELRAVVDSLQQRIAERRRSGDYPPGMEEQLEAEFTLIMAAVHRNEVNSNELGRRIRNVEQSVAAVRSDGSTDSRVPGGSTLHATTARLVNRHTGIIADSVRALGSEIAAALSEVHRLVDVQRSADERQLSDVIGAVIDRLAVLDHLADAVVHIEARLDALEAGSVPTS